MHYTCKFKGNQDNGCQKLYAWIQKPLTTVLRTTKTTIPLQVRRGSLLILYIFYPANANAAPISCSLSIFLMLCYLFRLFLPTYTSVMLLTLPFYGIFYYLCNGHFVCLFCCFNKCSLCFFPFTGVVKTCQLCVFPSSVSITLHF